VQPPVQPPAPPPALVDPDDDDDDDNAANNESDDDDDGNNEVVIGGPGPAEPPIPDTNTPTDPDLQEYDNTEVVSNGGQNSYSHVRETFGEDARIITIGDLAVPLFGPAGMAYWALANLILLLFGIALVILVTIRAVVRKRKSSNEKDRELMLQMYEGKVINESDINYSSNRQNIAWILVSGIIAICGVILFMITQDMTRTMVLLDIWTTLHILFVGVNLIACLLITRRVSKKNKSSSNDDTLSDPDLQESPA